MRDIEIRGKRVRFSSRVLKNGETAYYRNGKRQKTPYQKRIVKGLLSGKTYSQARGHISLPEKRITQAQIEGEEDFHLGNWAARPTPKDPQRHQYYAKVRVTSESFRQVGSDPKTGDVCTVATLTLYDPDNNSQLGFTYKDLNKRFSRVLRFTLQKYGLTLCTGSLSADVVYVWRHT